jgi:uncharacterized protein
MKLEQSFEVEAPIERVWEALVDVERVAPCLPGAAIDRVDDQGVYHGTFQVKLGPTTASYRGTLEMQSVDEAARSVTMKAHGSDKRGQGSANATMASRLTQQDGVTRVDVETDFTITGRLARFGRGGMIQDVSNRLLREFASCLQSSIVAEPAVGPAGEPTSAETGSAASEPAADRPAAPPPQAKPIKGISLFFGALMDRIRRLFRRRR